MTSLRSLVLPVLEGMEESHLKQQLLSSTLHRQQNLKSFFHNSYLITMDIWRQTGLTWKISKS
ncbi:hypothetical protein DBR43_01810 [Pedobacter sp. KBW06]|uniref:hypothetical protein n=1 Tax=Pedobacter sp. KBW06 TaxID=2153359 RepID=UPI000F596272|nr:hypothetical protein [Pedobacter sp. KBW06]RQO74161.1 hypothetical protein DBR43_01810 [Pedobacter sp. KBW06]